MGGWRVLSAAAHRGQGKVGVRRGPESILRWLPPQASYHKVDLSQERNAWYDALRVAERLEPMLRLHAEPILVLGGDHSLSAGSVLATRRVHPTAKVLWIDAHADVNTYVSSPSGNVHGMPLAALCGRSDPFVQFSSVFQALDPKDLTYLGLRDVDEDEAQWINEQRAHGLTAYTIHDLRSKGVNATMDALRTELGDAPVHVSFDIDVLDPSLAPGTGTPVPCGMQRDELEVVLELLRTLSIQCMDLVEVNPDLDDEEERTACIAAYIASSVRSVRHSYTKT
jgi:arginase